MRRTRFARAVEKPGAGTEKVSVAQALLFDIKTPESRDEASLSDWRLASLTHVAVLLGVTHLLVTGTCATLFMSRSTGMSFDNPLIPSAIVIVLDAIAATLLFARRQLNISSYMMVRGLCVYLAAVGIIWTWYGLTLADDLFVTAASTINCEIVAPDNSAAHLINSCTSAEALATRRASFAVTGFIS